MILNLNPLEWDMSGEPPEIQERYVIQVITRDGAKFEIIENSDGGIEVRTIEKGLVAYPIASNNLLLREGNR